MPYVLAEKKTCLGVLFYFSQDVFTGDRITKKHIRRIRQGYGLEAKYYDEILAPYV